MKFFALLIFLVLFCRSFQTEINSTRGYIFTAPKRFFAGRYEKGCFSLHNVEPPVHVVLELRASSLGTDETTEEMLARTDAKLLTKTNGPDSCLELNVPFTKHSVGKLKLSMTFEKHPDYVVNAEKEVLIENDSILTFVETDKPVYKPGQDVHIRILMLKHDLKPWTKPIPRIWIENPSEVRLAQWTNTTTDTGMSQLTFSLDKEATPGTWRIKVEKAHQVIYPTAFEVKKYVLPRFQVTINAPPYILADAANITWRICAIYSYGKPVRGTLILKTTPQTPSWRRKLHEIPDINYETKVESEDGCTNFSVAGEHLGLSHWKVAPNNVILMANFTEAGTSVVEIVSSKTIVVQQSLKLEFAPYTPRYFKLGLPYHGKLRVVHNDDTPAPNEKIQVCLRVRAKDEWLRVVVECRNFTSSSEGFVDFVVPPQHKNIVLLSFVATGVEYPTKYYSPDKRWRVFMDQPSAYIDVNLWYSPSDSYLLVARGYQPIICEEKYPFNVMYTAPINATKSNPVTFYYSINSKGRLLIFGHIEHTPGKESLLNYSEFHNLLGAAETLANRTDQNQVVHRFPLSVKITPSMAPVSELLLYYVRSDGETVAATHTIEVGNCFDNKVKINWENESQRPGSSSKLHVETSPYSLCGISAVDRSTRFLSSSSANRLDADTAFKRLRRFHLSPEARPMQSTWSHCGKNKTPPKDPFENGEDIDHMPVGLAAKNPIAESRRRRHVPYSSGTNYVDTIQAFDDFGSIVMSDLTLETRPCPQNWVPLPMAGERMDEPGNPFLDRMPVPLIMENRMIRTMMAMPLVFHMPMEPEMTYADQLPDQSPTLRSYFPETWLWDLVKTNQEGKAVVESNIPDTITNWIGQAVCVSPSTGLGIAPKTKITAFQPFFLDYTLPYSVKRGEILHLKVSLFNYMQHSLPVQIKLEGSEHLELKKGTSPIAIFCAKARESVVHEYLLKPKILGEINVTVTAEIDENYGQPCGPENLVYMRDSIVKPVLVKPEGFPVEETNSAFICPKDFIDDTSLSWNLTLPKSFVPDSARATVSLIGDILGPAIDNLDNLVRLPMGCGEQNMILFVPNIHVINYFNATGKDNPQLIAKALKNMQKGYQRELNYRHADGSYSAFGPDSPESTGSMWLTAFVVKSFAQARPLMHIDERDLKMSVKWIVRKQLENGCFPVIGRVFHKDMKGGLKDNEDGTTSALTAYVLIALLESGISLPTSLIDNAVNCLQKGLEKSEDSGPYTLAITTYALTLLNHPKSNASLENLLSRATRNKGLTWWEDKSKQSQVALSIEMTTYAVLTLIKVGGEDKMVEALKAVRWMAKQRNSGGGFSTTQDTVLGLEALTKYATAMSVNSTEMLVLVTAGPSNEHTFKMNDDNKMVLSSVAIPDLPSEVNIFAEGEGCVLIQSSLYYNKKEATGSEAFEITVSTSTDMFMDECSNQRLSICARYKLADEESNMALVEVGMISGYAPDKDSLQTLVEDRGTNIQRYEVEKDNVVLYFNKLTSQKTCVSFVVNREHVVDLPEPANIKLYDYYQQELSVSTKYTFPQMCSSAPQPDDDKNQQIPNPVPVEPAVLTTTLESSTSLPSTNQTEDAEIAEEVQPVMKALRKNNPSQKNKLSDGDEPVKSLNKMQGIESRSDNAPLVESLEPKVNGNDDSLSQATGVFQIDIGSGGGAEEEDNSFSFPNTVKKLSNGTDKFEQNPTFTIVSYDLEVPDGIEGPSPVYVKPPSNFNPNISFIDESFLPRTTLNNAIDYNYSVSEKNPITDEETAISSTRITEESLQIDSSCPVCGDELPENLKELICSSKGSVKIAVRSNRRVRLLWKVYAAPYVTRILKASIYTWLDPKCSCPAIDKPGSFALLLDSKTSNYAAMKNRSQLNLNSTISLYTINSRNLTFYYPRDCL